MTAKKKSTHRNAEVHARIMAALRAMSADERRQVLIDARILTPAGKLTKPYRTASVLSYRDPLTEPATK